MTDKLDELLRLGFPKSEPSIASFTVPHSREHIVDEAVLKIESGADAVAVFDSVWAKGVEEGGDVHQGVLNEFHELRRRYGEDLARSWLRDQHSRASKDMARAAVERRQLRSRIGVPNEQILHGKAIQTAIAEGQFVFKPRPFVLGNSRCSCHEILEQINDDLRRPRLLEAGADEAVDKSELITTHHFVLRAHKFDLRSLRTEDIEPNAAFSYELEREGLLSPPFPECIFEWDVEPNLTIAAFYIADLAISSLVRVPGAGWAAWDHLPADAHGRCNLLTDHVEKVCRAAIVILNSNCAEQIAITPDPKKNRQRERGGKLPLFEHTVVEIRGYQLDHKGAPAGRTHRSPRMHWRRGHLRRFRNQAGEIYRVTPIAPMLVGSATLGKIDHEYKVATTKLRHRSSNDPSLEVEHR